MTKYFALLAVIFSIFGLASNAQADVEKKENPVSKSSMQFAVDADGDGVDDEEQDRSERVLGD